MIATDLRRDSVEGNARLPASSAVRTTVGEAECKERDFNFPVPDVTVEGLPLNAMIQLDGSRAL